MEYNAEYKKILSVRSSYINDLKIINALTYLRNNQKHHVKTCSEKHVF